MKINVINIRLFLHGGIGITKLNRLTDEDPDVFKKAYLKMLSIEGLSADLTYKDMSERSVLYVCRCSTCGAATPHKLEDRKTAKCIICWARCAYKASRLRRKSGPRIFKVRAV